MTIQARHLLIASALIAVGVGVCVVNSPAPLAPEVAINAAIDAGVAALENGDADALMDLVHDDFRGNLGDLGQQDRAGISRYVGLYLLREGGISVRVVTRSIELQGEDEASVTLRVVGVRGGVGGALQGDIEADTVRLGFARDGAEWLVRSASR